MRSKRLSHREGRVATNRSPNEFIAELTATHTKGSQKYGTATFADCRREISDRPERKPPRGGMATVYLVQASDRHRSLRGRVTEVTGAHRARH
jgi:hypothetical protein